MDLLRIENQYRHSLKYFSILFAISVNKITVTIKYISLALKMYRDT